MNTRVNFIVQYVTGEIPQHSSDLRETLLVHPKIGGVVNKTIKKQIVQPHLNFFTRLSVACVRRAKGVSTHAMKKIEKRKIEALTLNEEGILKKKGRSKLVQRNTIFGQVPVLVKEDTHKTVKKIKDMTFARSKKLLPRKLTGFVDPTSHGLNFLECVKFMSHCVIFFMERCGYKGHKLRGPVRDRNIDYHILFKVTPDGTDRTKRAKCTKFQVFQLLIDALSRMHCLNLFQFAGDVGEAHVDCEFNASHIAEVLAQNLEEPVVTTVFIDFINRENFWNSFATNPENMETKTATFGAFVGCDLLALFKLFGLGGARSLMPDPSTPLTFDELSNVFWFPVEDPDNPDCEITQIYEHLFQNVLGEGGGKANRRARYRNRATLLSSRCKFYSGKDYDYFNEQIRKWRDDQQNFLYPCPPKI